MSDLVAEVMLRLAKAGLAALIGVGIFLVAVGLLGEPASASLALLSWLSGAAFILLIETSPL
ncbi:hypothetical protein BH23CHL6_BH23CHL6_09220 [soil metagenome]